MSKTLSREDLNGQDKGALEKILKKDVGSLSESEIATLRARRSYLVPREEKDFKEVLEDKPEYEKMKNSELEEMLKERKIEIPETAKYKKDFVALLEKDDEEKE